MNERKHGMFVCEYKTIKATDELDLDTQVNEAIQQGFQPFGNPYSPDLGHIYQAMVKEPTTKRHGQTV